MVRVLIVDDYALWRRLIVDILAIRQDVQIVGEAQGGLSGIQMAAELQPDIVILDIGLPDRNGIEVARQILELSPRTRILFLSQNNSKEVIDAAMSTGAHAYVVKSNATRDLPAAFDAVVQGNFFVRTSVFEIKPREPRGTLVSHTGPSSRQQAIGNRQQLKPGNREQGLGNRKSKTDSRFLRCASE